MPITKGQFRWLVAASVLVGVVGVVVSFVGESSLPAPLRDYLAAEREPDLTARNTVMAVVAIALLIAVVPATAGLYCFWRFARPLWVVAWIVGLVFQVFAGPTVDSGLATSLYQLSSVLAGIIFAVIYMTPAKAWFETTHGS